MTGGGHLPQRGRLGEERPNEREAEAFGMSNVPDTYLSKPTAEGSL